MTAVEMPARTWGDDDDAPRQPPTVIVSSRDGEAVPRVPAVARLVKVAEANGWLAVQSYALASVPDRPRKPAHMLASVALWVARGDVRGWAVWANEDDRGWHFVAARIGTGRVGARGIAARLAVTP